MQSVKHYAKALRDLFSYSPPKHPVSSQNPASGATVSGAQKSTSQKPGTQLPPRKRIRGEDTKITVTTPNVSLTSSSSIPAEPTQVKLYEEVKEGNATDLEPEITPSFFGEPAQTSKQSGQDAKEDEELDSSVKMPRPKRVKRERTPDTPTASQPAATTTLPSVGEVYEIDSDSEPELKNQYRIPNYFHNNLMNAFTEGVLEGTKLRKLSIPLPRGGYKTLEKKDLETLNPGEWLNDEIINASFALYDLRANNRNPSLKLKTFNSFHLQSVKKGTVNKKKHGLPREIKDLHRIIFPIHRINHWVLIVVDIQKEKVFSIDSLLTQVVVSEAGSIQAWLESFYRNELDSPASADLIKSFTTEALPIPMQPNGSDCGSAIIKAGGYFYEPEGKLPEKLDEPSYEAFRKIIRRTLEGCSHTATHTHRGN